MSNTKPRKLILVRKPTEPLRLEQGEAVHVGVVVHKASYSVALFSDRRGLVITLVQHARAEVHPSGCDRSARGSPGSSTRPVRPASACHADSGPRGTKPR